MAKVKLIILGATGAVGTEMLKVLQERKFPIDNLKLLADKNDAGKKIIFRDKEYVVEEATENSFEGYNMVMVAVAHPISRKFTPIAVKCGAIVIDNSSEYRLDSEVPLVIPEINPDDVDWHKGIIANPNCSTIIGLVAINALNEYSPITRIIASTYQAVSGAGVPGMKKLAEQSMECINNKPITPGIFQHRIAFNLIPHIDEFYDNGYTKEEMKLVNEGRKIFHNANIKIACTSVRVPVFRSHSESLNIQTKDEISAEKAKELLRNAKGVKLVDDPASNIYPMPMDSSDQDLIFVGRVRKDLSSENSLNLWCCGDQIRKGAATNAVQIAELILKKNLLK